MSNNNEQQAAQGSVTFFECRGCGHYYMQEGVICDCMSDDRTTMPVEMIRAAIAQGAVAWDTLSREWAINGMPADKQRLARAAFDAGRSAALRAAPEVTRDMVAAAEEAYMPFGDMELALNCAIAARPQGVKDV